MTRSVAVAELSKINPLHYATDIDGSIDYRVQEISKDSGLSLSICRGIAAGIEAQVELEDGTIIRLRSRQ